MYLTDLKFIFYEIANPEGNSLVSQESRFSRDEVEGNIEI